MPSRLPCTYLEVMRDLEADTPQVEAAYRLSWERRAAIGSDSEGLRRELARQGLGNEWTQPNMPSYEIVMASWRAGHAPEEAMEILRFALAARRRRLDN